MSLTFLRKPALSLPTRYVTFLVGLFMAAVILLTRQFHFGAVMIPIVIMAIFLIMQLYKEEVEFDSDRGKLRKIRSLFGIKTNKPWEYDVRAIERIFVNEWRYTQSYTSSNSSRTITDRGTQYRVFLKFDDGSKEMLTSSARRTWLFSELKALSTAIGIEVRLP